ncbi:aldo/keto reductase [Streptomyces sp. NPDC005506]|uniref:aldo/keto reductase n=1 Tax=Streptomyces sp. NPDC005506 TaxID=3364718 RepID=UPI0036CE0DB9
MVPRHERRTRQARRHRRRPTQVAAETGSTPAQVALAWLLARSDMLCPIPGTSSLPHLEENVAAASLRLTGEQIARLTVSC